ncbi:hypothetical protein B566_EDAN001395 [Ephemera danica]|nr:hypothetical protein B566_EDAN001395 [Ephemera danica]
MSHHLLGDHRGQAGHLSLAAQDSPNRLNHKFKLGYRKLRGFLEVHHFHTFPEDLLAPFLLWVQVVPDPQAIHSLHPVLGLLSLPSRCILQDDSVRPGIPSCPGLPAGPLGPSSPGGPTTSYTPIPGMPLGPSSKILVGLFCHVLHQGQVLPLVPYFHNARLVQESPVLEGQEPPVLLLFRTANFQYPVVLPGLANQGVHIYHLRRSPPATSVTLLLLHLRSVRPGAPLNPFTPGGPTEPGPVLPSLPAGPSSPVAPLCPFIPATHPMTFVTHLRLLSTIARIASPSTRTLGTFLCWDLLWSVIIVASKFGDNNPWGSSVTIFSLVSSVSSVAWQLRHIIPGSPLVTHVFSVQTCFSTFSFHAPRVNSSFSRLSWWAPISICPLGTPLARDSLMPMRSRTVEFATAPRSTRGSMMSDIAFRARWTLHKDYHIKKIEGKGDDKCEAVPYGISPKFTCSRQKLPKISRFEILTQPEETYPENPRNNVMNLVRQDEAIELTEYPLSPSYPMLPK